MPPDLGAPDLGPPDFLALARWLSVTLEEPGPVVRPASGPVQTLALALELGDVPPELQADALFVHRSRGVGGRWPGMGILGVHDGFDRHLTTGPNVRLARALGWQQLELAEWDRASALLATPPQESWEDFHAALLREFGGEDASFPPTHPSLAHLALAGPALAHRAPAGPAPLRVALVNAMRPGLLQEAAARGVSVYLTGQLRPSALAAAQALGLGIVALGHRRTELWGLRQLARELERAFPGLRMRVFDREQS